MTELQLQALDIIRADIERYGVSPTYAEIAAQLGLASKSQIARLVDALVSQGKLRRTANRKRGLELGGTPDLRIVDGDLLRAELARRGETLDALMTPRVLTSGKTVTCAADSCWEPVKIGHLFCPRHWAVLPRHLRDSILAAHATATRDPRNPDKRRAYQELVSRARDMIDTGIAA